MRQHSVVIGFTRRASGFQQTILGAVDSFLKINRRTLVLAVLEVEVGDIVVAHTGSFVVTKAALLVHFTCFSQVDNGEYILSVWVLKEIVLGELFVLYQVLEDTIQLGDLIRRTFAAFQIALVGAPGLIKHDFFHLGV